MLILSQIEFRCSFRKKASNTNKMINVPKIYCYVIKVGLKFSVSSINYLAFLL